MFIYQFEDKFLSHFSYAISHENEVVLIDPSRDPKPYFDFTNLHSAKLIAVVETHLHADFVSSHVEIAKETGAEIFMHPAAQPEFSFQPFGENTKEIQLGEFSLHAIHTPGHSPDSICILLRDEKGKITTAFTGDTLFIGDVGRPDLRETTFTHDATREKLARQMYYSVHEKILKLDDDVLVYPAHGSGSLCGKNLSANTFSTIGTERISNIALQSMSEDVFVDMLLEDQPMTPKYFSHCVATNRKKEIKTFQDAIKFVLNAEVSAKTRDEILIVDARNTEMFRQSHLKNSINIPGDNKFETWVGTLISPGESFLLFGENQNQLASLTERIVKIGYENNLKGVFTLSSSDEKLVQSNPLDVYAFTKKQSNFTIVDVRNKAERNSQTVFKNSIHIPLHQLRERIAEIPGDKPVVTHCGGGNRGAIAASILEAHQYPVYDLGMNVKNFIAEKASL